MTIFDISNEKKYEYWNHFLAQAFLGNRRIVGITAPQLRKLRRPLWRDAEFWRDIVGLHGGSEVTPEEMRRRDSDMYNHCADDFWAMIAENLHEYSFSV